MFTIMLFLLMNTQTSAFSSPLEIVRIQKNNEQIHAITTFIAQRMNDECFRITRKLRSEDSLTFTRTFTMMKSKINAGYSTKFIEKELQKQGVGSFNHDYQCLFIGIIFQSLILRGKIEELVLYFDMRATLTDVYVLTTDNLKITLNEEQSKWLRIQRSELEDKRLLLPLSIR